MKKTISLFIIGAATVLTPLNSPNVFAQTTSQVSNLTQADVPLIIPKYLPKGFRLTNFEVNKNHGYKALYQGANNCKVLINAYQISGSETESTSLPSLVRSWDINSAIFGKVKLIEKRFERRSNSTYLSMEAPSEEADRSFSFDPGYDSNGRTDRPVRIPSNQKYFLKFECKNLAFSSQEAIKITQSLEVKNSYQLRLRRFQQL